MDEKRAIIKYKGSPIRVIMDEQGVVWYALSDVMEALLSTDSGANVIRHIKKRDTVLAADWDRITVRRPVSATGGKVQMVCAKREHVMRLVNHTRQQRRDSFERWLRRTEKKMHEA